MTTHKAEQRLRKKVRKAMQMHDRSIRLMQSAMDDGDAKFSCGISADLAIAQCTEDWIVKGLLGTR